MTRKHDPAWLSTKEARSVWASRCAACTGLSTKVIWWPTSSGGSSDPGGRRGHVHRGQPDLSRQPRAPLPRSQGHAANGRPATSRPTAVIARAGRPLADCLFCGIVAGDIPADMVRTESHRGLPGHPPAGAHPRTGRPPASHRRCRRRVERGRRRRGDRLITAAKAVADAEGIGGADRGYRLVFNVGPDALNWVRPPPPPRPRRPTLAPARLTTRPRAAAHGTTGVRPAGRVVPDARGSHPGQDPVPGNHLMAGLLGQHDELLRLVEEPSTGYASPSGATRSPSRARPPNGWAACSRS